MRASTTLLLALVAQAIASPCPKGCGKNKAKAAKNAKAIYVLSNEKANAVVAMPIGKDGMVGKPVSTATGGEGATGVDDKGQPAVPDALFSQSAVTVAGKNLFAVNPGSNTLTMFAIDPKDPTKLAMVGKPAAIPGEFPVTVGASSKNKMACVGTSGAKAGISCASFSDKGLGKMDALRPIDLGQTTPPKGPTNTVSQVFFSRDQKTLFSTVKGDPPTNKDGFIASFPVAAAAAAGQAAKVDSKMNKATPDGTKVLFGATTIPGSKDLFVTDAAFGAVVLAMDQKTQSASTVKGKGEVDGQKATCWATVSPATGTAFVTDVGSNRLVEMSTKDAKVLNTVELTNGDPGLIDLQAAGSFVYALSPGNGTTPAAVTVVDAKSRKQVQHVQMDAKLAGKNSMGLAMLK
uniref:3-carboxymuconate cyclase n=1 Tax=Pyricularia oryzae (strain P131) TaxID=1143193 RepID=L7IVV1_PYRO1